MSAYLVLGCLLSCATAYAAPHLSVQGTKFYLDGKHVFLSGVNQPWINYGQDFGGSSPANGNGNGKFCELDTYLRNISQYGGNSIRFWVFCDCNHIPVFNSSGYVVKTDSEGSLISDMKRYVRQAAGYNIMTFFSLVNGAVNTPQHLKDMVIDEGKTQSFIDVVVTPLVKAMAGESGLGGWEIFNEPEGSVIPDQTASHPCQDTTPLKNTGAGWAGHVYSMVQLQKFHNRVAAAIHTADPNALVTTGSWSAHSITNAFKPVDGQGYRAYWTDECLMLADGNSKGVLDFFEVHTYARPHYQKNEPFLTDFAAYNLTKPLVIGEFAHVDSGMSSAQQYQYAIGHGYSGSWGWDAIGGSNVDDLKVLEGGMAGVEKNPLTHVQLNGNLSHACDCSDKPPPSEALPGFIARYFPEGYTCAQQASWGKCQDSWMKGYCCRSCFDCKGCQ